MSGEFNSFYTILRCSQFVPIIRFKSNKYRLALVDSFERFILFENQENSSVIRYMSPLSKPIQITSSDLHECCDCDSWKRWRRKCQMMFRFIHYEFSIESIRRVCVRIFMTISYSMSVASDTKNSFMHFMWHSKHRDVNKDDTESGSNCVRSAIMFVSETMSRIYIKFLLLLLLLFVFFIMFPRFVCIVYFVSIRMTTSQPINSTTVGTHSSACAPVYGWIKNIESVVIRHWKSECNLREKPCNVTACMRQSQKHPKRIGECRPDECDDTLKWSCGILIASKHKYIRTWKISKGFLRLYFGQAKHHRFKMVVLPWVVLDAENIYCRITIIQLNN